ncbi:MAG: hypothetical protein JW751_26875 [Polyangiaceae bacterium]|nr:hypothetical protein [Polyangiaceae bacterium]
MTRTSTRMGMLLLAVLPLVTACGDGKNEEETPANVTWVDQTYTLTIPKVAWTVPAGLFGEDLGGFVPAFIFDMGALTGGNLAVTATSLVVPEAGQAQQLTQQMCNPTTDTSMSTAAYPSSQIGPIDFPLYLKNGDRAEIGKVYGLTITGILPDGATPATTGVFSGTIDVRELWPLFTGIMASSGDSVCTALPNFDPNNPISCQPCPHDGAVYCVSMQAEGLGATAVTPMTIQPVGPTVDPATCPLYPLS